MNATSPDLTDPQRVAVAHLASGARKRDAAEAAGVHPSTVSHWLRERVFVAALDDARNEVQDAARYRLVSSTLAAVDALVSIVQDPAASASARIRAACAILDRGGLGKETQVTHRAPEPDVWRDAANDLARLFAAADSEAAVVAALASLDDDTLDALAGDLEDDAIAWP